MTVEVRDGEIIIQDQDMIDLAYEFAELTRLPIELALLMAIKNELNAVNHTYTNLEIVGPRKPTQMK